MQVSLFSVAPGDSRALDELNRCLRGHRVLTLDRHCDAGVWSFCVTWQPGTAEALPAEKVDYKALLDAPTFALFAKLREVRKGLAEKENPPAYAVFANEQLTENARWRPTSGRSLGSGRRGWRNTGLGSV